MANHMTIKSLSILVILTLFKKLVVLLIGGHVIRSLRGNFTSPLFEHREDVGKCWLATLTGMALNSSWRSSVTRQWITMPITRNTADDSNFKADFQVIALHDSLPSLESNGNHS